VSNEVSTDNSKTENENTPAAVEGEIKPESSSKCSPPSNILYDTLTSAMLMLSLLIACFSKYKYSKELIRSRQCSAKNNCGTFWNYKIKVIELISFIS